MDVTGFERLTEGQKECLRLFHARFEVKDIARRIGRSPVTVHQRLAAARRHLGVDRSVEAARLLAEHEGGGVVGRPVGNRTPVPSIMPDTSGEQPLVEGLGGPERIEASETATFDLPVGRLEGRSGMYGSSIYDAAMMGGAASGRARAVAETPSLHDLPLPFPTRSRPVNDMGLGAKLIYVVVLAALVALVFGGTVAALAGLSELF